MRRAESTQNAPECWKTCRSTFHPPGAILRRLSQARAGRLPSRRSVCSVWVTTGTKCGTARRLPAHFIRTGPIQRNGNRTTGGDSHDRKSYVPPGGNRRGTFTTHQKRTIHTLRPARRATCWKASASGSSRRRSSKQARANDNTGDPVIWHITGLSRGKTPGLRLGLAVLGRQFRSQGHALGHGPSHARAAQSRAGRMRLDRGPTFD